jgi:lysozyme
MKISAHGISFLKTVEGCKLTAYLDSGGVLTIGVGHTGPEVFAGMVISDAKATAFLLADLAVAEAAVNSAVKVPISQALYDSLVSIFFNAGVTALSESTLVKLLNGGDAIGAISEFARWSHDNGKPVKGLLSRRVREMSIALEN